MATQTIVLYRATIDNMGLFVDAGSEMTISEADTADAIDADRASEQMDTGGAVTPAEAEADEQEAEDNDPEPDEAQQPSGPQTPAPDATA